MLLKERSFSETFSKMLLLLFWEGDMGKAAVLCSGNRCQQWGSLSWINKYTCWFSASILWNNYCTSSHQQASNQQSQSQVTDCLLQCLSPYHIQSSCKILDLIRLLTFKYSSSWGLKLFVYQFLNVWVA